MLVYGYIAKRVNIGIIKHNKQSTCKYSGRKDSEYLFLQ